MKTIPTALAADYAANVTTMATALKITRPDATVFGFTSASSDVTIDGVLYKSNPGLDVSQIVTAAGSAVGNLETTTLHDETTFTTADILGGLWRNAAFLIFRYNWAAPSHGIDGLLAGNVGEVTINQNTVVAELRDLRQYLQQPVGSASSKTCRYRLGSADKNNGGLCMVDISGPPFAVTGTITDVYTNRDFGDTGRTEGIDYFGDGLLTWLTGNNAGLSYKIHGYTAAGIFGLALLPFRPVLVGDTYRAVAGCRKSREDCRDKFNNVLNFGGEPDRPSLDSLTQAPEAAV